MKLSGRESSRLRRASPRRRIENRAPAGRADCACPRRSTLDLRSAGFTLIELILVLALLGIVTSLAAPALSNFFRGRALNSEARQLLSLTHAGQSRAISDGFPMLLWIDKDGRAYGLQEETSAASTASPAVDPKAEEFSFNDNLQIEAVDAPPLPVSGRSLPAIRFLPDGMVDENSARAVRLTSQSGETLWLVQATNRLNYELSRSDR